MNSNSQERVLESLIGKKFEVLNQGHVVLVDVMGDDQAVVDAARTCYQKGTRHTSDNRNLIRYLMRHRHTSPFESCQIKLHIKLPIFVERQWARHRTAGWNEVSARYSELPEEFYIPEESDVCEQSSTNRQGRGDTLSSEQAEEFCQSVSDLAVNCFDQYHKDLETGVARELARINLPLGTYTEKVWWISLHNILHFLGLRMDSHAQKEIRDYATIIGEQIIAPLFPEVWSAFKDYRLDGMFLTGLDKQMLHELMIAVSSGAQALPMSRSEVIEEIHACPGSAPVGWGNEKCRERDEFIGKMQALGLVVD
jgi:thymidylate synthase (FAD)